MKKYNKIIIILIAILAALISVCFVPINASKLIPVIEKQVANELGINIHIEKLILRVGPFIKVKAPIMHMMYMDGQKFGQFDNVKFYVSWFSIFKKGNLKISKLYANKLIIRVNSDDKYLPEIMKKMGSRNINETPEIQLKGYNISYLNKKLNDKYILEGQSLNISKVPNYNNFRINTTGLFSINNKKHLTYDLAIQPQIDIPDLNNKKFEVDDFLSQMEELDFYSDIIADLKLYKNSMNAIQASGFINIDNISVLDKNHKNPKSFVYLTLWGDKASILSNIYTSANKKVYIEGMVNNSKKPVVDIKVKTDEIKLNDLYQKIKLIADFSRIKGIKNIEGTLNANFTLKGDLNKIKSNGYMKITNAGVRASGLDIGRINSDIDFSNNVINIVNAVGYVNNAPIMAKGSIDKAINIELLMNKVELKYLCPASFGVQNGVASLVATVNGTLDNISHKENLEIENLKIVNKNNELGFESLKIDTNKNNSAYINNIVFKNPETEQLKIPSLRLNIERDSIVIPEFNIFMPNSKFTAKSEITNYNSGNITFTSQVNGFINTRDIKRINQFSTRYPLKILYYGNKESQNLNAQIQIERAAVLDEPAIINLISKIDKNSIKLEDLSIISFSGKLADNFKNNIKGQKKVIVTGNIDNIQTPVLKNVRIFIPQQLNINLYDTIAQIKGDLFLNGNLLNPDIVGQLTVQNLFNQMLQLGVSNSTLDFNKNNVIINAPQVKLADSSMRVDAVASTDISKAIEIKNLNIKSKYLNTDTILMYKDNPLVKSYPLNVQAGKFYSEKILANIYGAPLYLSAFSTDFKLNGDILSLSNISSEIFNGKLAGMLAYNMRDEHFDSNLMARGVSAAPIFDVISVRKDEISGIMDFDAAVKGELTSKQSLNGDIKFIVHNGRMSTLGRLEHLLYAQNVVADSMLRTSLSVVTKAITLKDTGLFKYLRGEVKLVNGIADIKMLQSQGPLMSLFIKGEYNPINDYARLVVLGRISDELVEGLGAFGDFSFNKLMVMLTGEEAKYNILPEDFDKLPQLTAKYTKEFRSIINGNIEKPSSVLSFNWISYTHKSLKQKEVPMTNIKVPSFVEELPY